MDDLEFRRHVYADPKCQNTEFLSKKNETEENHLFVDELQQFDKKLKRAMDIEPPKGLAERIILNQALQTHSRMEQQRFIFSIAASVLLVLGVFFYIFQPISEVNLEHEVLAHIYEELDHLIEQQDKKTLDINQALAQHGGEFIGDIGKINYLGSCDIANKKGIHVILAGTHGSITVLMLPDVSINKEKMVSDNRFHGSIIPTGSGSIAIIGEKNESLNEVKQTIKQKLSWAI